MAMVVDEWGRGNGGLDPAVAVEVEKSIRWETDPGGRTEELAEGLVPLLLQRQERHRKWTEILPTVSTADGGWGPQSCACTVCRLLL